MPSDLLLLFICILRASFIPIFSSSHHLNEHIHVFFIIIILPFVFKSTGFSGNPISSALPPNPRNSPPDPAVIKEKHNPVFRNIRFACWNPTSHVGLKTAQADPQALSLSPPGDRGSAWTEGPEKSTSLSVKGPD